MPNFSYDYSLMLRENVGQQGVAEWKFKNHIKKAKQQHRSVHDLLDKGGQTFVQNLWDGKHEREIQKTAESVKKRFSQLLVIGIGGSDLGARALQSAFRNKKTKQQVFFLGDTTDPEEMKRVFARIDWKHCAVNPVSKSGNTVETVSTFLAARRELIKAVGKNAHAKHVFVTTEPEKESILHSLVLSHGYELIPHPEHIGGRWTILSVVGLLSAAFTGVNIRQLRKGGRDFYESARRNSQNPAMIYTTLHYQGIRQGKQNAVLMPYVERMREFGAWYRQLFAESLGKAYDRDGKKIHTGVTPIAAAGPRDQHSQAQLYNEGPFDKLVTFVRIEKSDVKLSVPRAKSTEPQDFLNGHAYHDILNIEQESTALALAKHKRPSGTISIPRVDEYSVGQFILFFELSCAYLAEMLNINAYDQPGVEEGKKNMYALLGKDGFEQQAARLKKNKRGMKRKIAKI